MSRFQSLRLLLLAFVPLVAGLSPALSAQDWNTAARVQGKIETPVGEPIPGARVALAPEGGAAGAPREAIADEDGRWAIAGLAPGRWRIEIRAEGWVDSEGWVVASVPSGAPLRVVLRPLSEVAPMGWENNPLTVRAWLEKGNAFLEQGRPAEARGEYEKALRVLPEAERPEVLRAVARTHFLERDVGAAFDALRLALVWGPEDPETRKLLLGVGEAAGRQAESESWIRRVEAEPPPVLLAELGVKPETQEDWEVPESGWRDPVPHQVGRFRVRFEDRHPLGSPEVYAERHGLEREVLGEDSARYDLAQESFEVFVPESYRPGRPAGLLVWVSPVPWGGFTREATRELLERERIVWIGANRSGNQRPKWDRVGLALDAVYNMSRLYDLDPDRIWVAGYSGGGRTASALAVAYPEAFRGGMFFFGVDFYRDVPALDRPGAHWPAAFAEPPPERLAASRDRNRYALVTGELDFNRIQTRELYACYREEGFRHLTLIDVPGADHYTGLPAELLERALAAVDPAAGDTGAIAPSSDTSVVDTAAPGSGED